MRKVWLVLLFLNSTNCFFSESEKISIKFDFNDGKDPLNEDIS